MAGGQENKFPALLISLIGFWLSTSVLDDHPHPWGIIGCWFLNNHYSEGEEMFRARVRGEDVGEFSTFTEAFQAFWPKLGIIDDEAVGDSAIVWCEAAEEGRLDLPQIRMLAYTFGLLTEDGELVVKTTPSPTFVPVVMERAVGRFSSFTKAFVVFHHSVEDEKRDCGGWIHTPVCYIEWHESSGGEVYTLDFAEVREMAYIFGLINEAGELLVEHGRLAETDN